MTDMEETMMRNYYGKNYDKAMKNYDESMQRAKADLLEKYPHATLSKFDFNPVVKQDGNVTRVDVYFINSSILSTDITSSTFKNDQSMWKWLHNNAERTTTQPDTGPFPRIWSSGGTVQKLLLIEKTTPSELNGNVTTFPPYVLDYQIHNFDIFVSATNSFKYNLPKIVIDTKLMYRPLYKGAPGNLTSTSWTLTKSYYQAITAMYIVTYRSGLTIHHVTPSTDIPKQITSLMRFHMYLR